MTQWHRINTALLTGVFPLLAHAQLPLSIEQLLVADRRWQFASAIDVQTARLAPGLQQDARQLTALLRYGVGPRLELNARFIADRYWTRQPGRTERADSQVVDIGANWLIKREAVTPALLIEARSELIARRAAHSQFLAGGQLVMTTYQSFDPVVLSLTGSLLWQSAYRQSGERWQPGAAWSLSPQVSFAVNHRVTLIGGLSYSRRDRTRIDGVPQGRAAHQVGLRAGLGFTPSAGHTLFVSGEYNSAATGGLTLQWLRDF